MLAIRHNLGAIALRMWLVYTLVIVISLSLFSGFVFASDAWAAYLSTSSSGSSYPHIRYWNSSANAGAGGYSAEILLPTAGSPIYQIKVRSSPIDSKVVVITSSADGNMDAYVCIYNCTDPTRWAVTNNFAAVPVNNFRDFDFAFEKNSGNLVVVYSVVSVSSTQDLAYIVLPDNVTNFSGQSINYIDDTTSSADIQYTWVEMDSNPISSSGELIMDGFDSTDSRINAWIWNGTSWGNENVISSSAISTGGYEALAATYSSSGSKAMAVGGNGTTGNVDYAYWNGSIWSTTGTFDINGAGTGGNNDVRYISLKADPSSDNMQLVGVDSGSALSAAYWNNSTWAVTARLDTRIDISTDRPVDFSWLPTGSTGRLVWDTNTTGTTLSQRLCSPQCTGTTSTISTYSGAGRWLTLFRNPTSSDTENFVGIRLNSNNQLGSFWFNGASFTNYGDTTLATSTGSSTFESYCMAFDIDTRPPAISFVSPTPANDAQVPLTDATINITASEVLSSAIVGFDGVNYSMTPAASSSNEIWNYTFSGLSYATHNYTVYVYDAAGNLNFTQTQNFTTYFPLNITLISPSDSSLLAYNNVSFLFNVSDVLTISNCSLYINGTINQTNSSVNQLIPQNFTIFGMPDGQYSWSIGCYDTGSPSNFLMSQNQTVQISATIPVAMPIIPLQDSGDVDGNVDFNFSIADSHQITNCSLLFGGYINQTNTSINKSLTQSFKINGLAIGRYNWSAQCIDSVNNSLNFSIISFDVFRVTGFSGSTTDFSSVNTSAILNLTLENPFYGKVIFNSTTNLSGGSDIDSAVSIANNSIAVNSSLEPRLNKSATIYFYNLSYELAPIVLRDGLICTDCNVINYAGGTLAVQVLHFSNYTTSPTSSLSIWDSSDPQGGSTPAYTNANVLFYANYTNSTSGLPISLASCNISFLDLNASMKYNSSIGVYIFNRTFATTGQYNWNISCNGSSAGFEPLSLKDNVTILQSGALNITLLYPNISVNASYGNYFNLSMNVSCLIGTCSNISVLLDPSTAWWNNSWTYKESINVSESAGTSPAGYQILLSLNGTNVGQNWNWTNECLAGNDSRIRFLNGSEDALLPYWVQDCSASGHTMHVWVRVDQNITSSPYAIYMYYGNPSATGYSNGSATFDYFDAGDQVSNWNVVGTAGVNSTFGLAAPSYYATSVNGNYMYRNIGLTPNSTLSFNVNSNGLGNFYFLANSAGAGQIFRAETRGGNNAGLGNSASWTSWSVPSATCANIAANTWYNFTIIIGPTTAQAYINGATCGSAFTFANNGPYIGLVGDGLGSAYTTWWDNMRVRKYMSPEPSVSIGSETAIGDKGAVPYGSGIPFYTITANPSNSSNASCLSSLMAGASCQLTWTVNTTGLVGSFWNFFATTTYDQGGSYANANSVSINITISNSTNSPSVANPALNATILNQSDSVMLNVSVTDSLMINSVIATILYPNGTEQNYSMNSSTGGYNYLYGGYYYMIFNDTLKAGIYDITHIIAIDQGNNVNDSQPSGLFFNVTAQLPGSFGLLLPANATQSNILRPNLSWQQSSSNHFANYTVLISTGPTFFVLNYTYIVAGLANTSLVLPSPLASNAKYYWRVIARDIFGSETNSSQDFMYIADTAAPSVVLDTPATNVYVLSSSVLLNYSASDANTLSNCTLYGNFSGMWAANQTNNSVVNGGQNYFSLLLPDGVYQWNVLCTDLAGNNAYYSSNYTFKVDTRPPLVNLMSPANNTLNQTTNNIFFEANATDAMSNLASCSLILDNSLAASSSSVTNGVPFNFTVVVLNGQHNWSVNCTDLNNFTGSSTVYNLSVSVTDTSPPLISMNYPVPDAYLQLSNVTFNFTPSDATGIENCSLYIDSTYNRTVIRPPNFAPSYFNVTGLSETLHTWQISCYDNSSLYNFGSSAIENFTVDLTNPTVNLSTPQNNTFIIGNTPYFNFTPNDTNLASCTLYGNFSGSFAANKSINPVNDQPNNISLNLPDGAYIWNIICTDLSGRSSFAQSNYTVKVDTTPPYYSNIAQSPSSPASYSPSQVYSFNITWKDNFNVSSVVIEENFSGIPQNQTPYYLGSGIYSYNITGLAVGPYYYRWYATDENGNTNMTNIVLYTVQKAQPTLNLTFNGTDSDVGINQSQSLNITASLVVPGSEYIELYIDGTLINNGTSPLSNITLFPNPGYYNVTMVYYGDSSYLPASRTHFVNVSDVTPPNISVSSPANSTTIGLTPVLFQFSVSDSSTLPNCSLYINNTLNQTIYVPARDSPLSFSVDMNDGNYTWRIECFDSYNNKGVAGTYYLTVRKTTAINVNVSATKQTYQLGEVVPVTINTTDIFNNTLSASVATAVIYTNTTTTGAVWYNSSLPYRKMIILTENNNTNTTGYQLNISIDTNSLISLGKMNASCSDIRFADSIGHSIPYYVASGCNTTSTLIWIKINLAANSSSEIYIYYGNSSFADASNASAVFDYFDAGDQVSNWNVVGTAGANSTFGLAAPSYYATSVNGNYMYRNIGLTPNSTLSFNVNSNGLGNFYFLANSAGAGQIFRAETRGGANSGLASATSWTVWTAPTGCANILTNTWYNFSIIIGATTAQAYINGATCGSAFTFTNNGSYIGLVGDALGAAYTTWWDNMIVRDYLAVSPTYNISANEERLVASYTNTTDSLTGTSSFDYDSFNNTLGNYSVVTYANASSAQGYNSTYYMLLADTTPPSVTIYSPLIGSLTGNTTMVFNYSTYDYSHNSTCNLTIDGSVNVSNINSPNSAFSNASVNITIAGFAQGMHYWNLTCWDTYNNKNTTATQNFIVDLTPPSISLISPVYGYNTSNISIFFSWNATDNYAINISCYVNIDGANVTGAITGNNSVVVNATVSGIFAGSHYWNMTCIDSVGNSNTSAAQGFYILGSPSSVSIQALNDSSIFVNWTSDPGATDYNVYITDNYSAGFPSSPNITGISSTNYTDNTANSTYRRFYKISAVRGNAESFMNMSVGKYDAALPKGFNLISIPFILDTYVLKNSSNSGYLFDTNSSCILSLWSYDPASGFYRTDMVAGSFVPATGSENFTSLNMSQGYWIETNDSCKLTLFGIVPYYNVSIGLAEAYNLVPWLDAQDKDLPQNYSPTLINTVPSNSVQAIDRYNSTSGQFEVTIHYMIGNSSWGWWPSYNNLQFTSLNPTYGYYFESNSTAVWQHEP